MASKTISWTRTAVKQFEKAVEYIASDSTKNAEKVSIDILKHLEKTIKNPEFFPEDKYKQHNDGSYRAFEKHHYRIAYRFTNQVIRVLTVRHTSREPKLY